MDEFELELKQDFLEESSDLLEAAESAFLRLEEERDNPELIDEIFRLAHNLKGTAKAVGFDQLAELTHVAENLILKLKNGTFTANDAIVTTLLLFKDKVFEMIEGLKDNFEASFEIDSLKESLTQLVNGEFEEIQAVEEVEDLEVESEIPEDAFDDMDADAFVEMDRDSFASTEVEDEGISEQAIESLRASGFDEETIMAMLAEEESEAVVEDESNIALATEPSQVNELIEEQAQPLHGEVKQAEESPASKPKIAAKNFEAEESIRVKLSRIDKMTNLIGELVVLQTVVSQRRFEFIKDDLSNKSIGHMGKLFKEIQHLSMSLRMLPLKGTFQKMNRIVRDTSKALDKKVKLHLKGEETEVDKTVLEKLADPLVHIIRNAVDHGLETDSQRATNGKSEFGNVELMAFHEGSNLVIQITDDGGGIDPAVIERKALEKKIIKPNHSLTDNEIINLIFHAGFSTKETVSEVSGRGVGMDVVKTNIESLGGEVRLMSKLGQGSSFKIILPLTLAIIEGIVIGAENEKFVLPLSQVYEISNIKRSEVESFSKVGKLFKLRGDVYPLFFINDKIEKKVTESEQYTVIVVRGLNYAFGVVVDDIYNQQQIVIKKLGDDLKGKKGIVGSAIMSDGMPSLILDLFELFKDDIKQNRAHANLKQRQASAA